MVVVAFWCGAGVAAAEAYVDSVPLPGDPPAPQASVLYYRDGRTILARVGTIDHNDVPLSSVPLGLRYAVLAAEDRDFFEHSGVSTRGIARAAVAVAKGGSQGASTITQQYARNAFLTQDFSVDRKTKEMALAVKLERRYSKDEILCRYLNTIYYGRGAYGIAAAAHAYFDIAPDRLTLSQGAVLAAVIKDPWNLDPANDPTWAKDRWLWVLGAMRDKGWLDQKTVDAQRYPTIRPRWAGSEKLDGPTGLVVDQVEAELAAHGITSQTLHTKGLSVVTTLDPAAQDAALDLTAATLRGQPKKLRAALVAVDPADGGVRAYYGGDRGRGYFDDALAPRPPASTFKPIVLAAGLRKGIGYLSRWDGSSPRTFPGRYGVPLNNRDDLQCPDCTLEESMVDSLNTPFYAVTEHLGGGDIIRDLAIQLGVSPTYDGKKSMVDVKGEPEPGHARSDISLGRYPVTPADLASVYATFAGGGVYNARHFVVSAADSAGTVLWTTTPRRRMVLDPGIAADVSVVLRTVVDDHSLAPGRPAAGKTGTQQWGDTGDNQDAWMAGYTPQLSVVVWMGQSVPGRIRDSSGVPISGETLPARLWRDFLVRALDHEEQVAFPSPAHVGSVDAGDAKRSVGDQPANEDDEAKKRSPEGVESSTSPEGVESSTSPEVGAPAGTPRKPGSETDQGSKQQGATGPEFRPDQPDLGLSLPAAG